MAVARTSSVERGRSGRRGARGGGGTLRALGEQCGRRPGRELGRSGGRTRRRPPPRCNTRGLVGHSGGFEGAPRARPRPTVSLTAIPLAQHALGLDSNGTHVWRAGWRVGRRVGGAGEGRRTGWHKGWPGQSAPATAPQNPPTLTSAGKGFDRLYVGPRQAGRPLGRVRICQGGPRHERLPMVVWAGRMWAARGVVFGCKWGPCNPKPHPWGVAQKSSAPAAQASIAAAAQLP